MRTLIAIELIALITLTAMGLGVAQADSGDKWKITDDRRRQIGDFYDPGHGRRLQLRDKDRRIIGYIERDGDITDRNRRKLGTLEDVDIKSLLQK